jgi:hypothetical protein
MSSQFFRLDEHTINASHIRGFPRSTATHENEVLQLAIKQYTPLNNANPKPGDITIIAAHANAFPKVRIFHLGRIVLSVSATLKDMRLINTVLTDTGTI